MSRFSQSANNFYSTVSYPRPNTSNYKVARNRIMSTGESFLPNNTVNTIANFRPLTSQIGRSSSSSFRNTKGKLQTLSDQLATLLEECKDTRLVTKDLQLKLDFLKEELNQKGIDPIKMNLTQEIKALQKSVKIKERSDMLKFQALHHTCQALNRNSKQIKMQLNNLSERMSQVQNILGFHGIKEKLKY